jgi:predicted N-acetyltransferase YhbS
LSKGDLPVREYQIVNDQQILTMWRMYNDSFDLIKTGLEMFKERLCINMGDTVCFIHEKDNQIVGFSIVNKNAILLLIVHEKYRNRGIGGDLLKLSENKIGLKYSTVSLVGSDSYIVCGVPMDTKSDYHEWFERRGFIHDWTSFDMIVDLLEFEPKEEFFTCSDGAVIFRKRTEDPPEKELCYQGAEGVQRGWGKYFLEDGVNAEIALKDNRVIGGNIIKHSDCIFNVSIEGSCHFGLIWVAEEWRNRGIGIKLYQDALIELKSAGYKTCHIGYTYLDAWYGKCGAKIYIHYWIGNKQL